MLKYGNLLPAVFLMLALAAARAGAQDRLPPIPADKMTEAQKKAAEQFRELRHSDPAGPPWSVLMRVPDYVVPSVEMFIHNRNNSAFNPKLTEFAILIAARHWTNNYEWNAHYPMAVRAGLSTQILTALNEGRRPDTMAKDEEILYSFCDELLHNQSVSDPTYAKALAEFGEAGVVEAASLEGYYSFLAMVMNAARTPVPQGTKPALLPFPRN